MMARKKKGGCYLKGGGIGFEEEKKKSGGQRGMAISRSSKRCRSFFFPFDFWICYCFSPVVFLKKNTQIGCGVGHCSMVWMGSVFQRCTSQDMSSILILVLGFLAFRKAGRRNISDGNSASIPDVFFVLKAKFHYLR